MMRAYHLRSLKQNGLEMRHMGSFTGQLLLRSIDRAERVYAAMQCRGFDGRFPVSGEAKLDNASVRYLVFVSIALILVRVIGFSNVLAWISTWLIGA